MGIEVITKTVASCDVPGCKVRDEIEGAFPDRAPPGWEQNVLGLTIICPFHSRQVKAAVAGKKPGPAKGTRKRLISPGGDSSSASLQGTNASNLGASGALEVHPSPARKRGSRGLANDPLATLRIDALNNQVTLPGITARATTLKGAVVSALEEVRAFPPSDKKHSLLSLAVEYVKTCPASENRDTLLAILGE